MQNIYRKVFSRVSLPRVLILLGILVLLALLLAWGANRAQDQEDQLSDQIQSHQMLLPYVSALTQREALVKELLQTKESVPQPQTVGETLKVLNELAVRAGIPDTRFMPKAISVIGRNDIQVTGIAHGKSEDFRRFLVVLSHQSWVRSFDHVRAVAGKNTPTFEVTLRTTYGASATNTGV